MFRLSQRCVGSLKTLNSVKTSRFVVNATRRHLSADAKDVSSEDAAVEFAQKMRADPNAIDPW